MQIQIPKRIYGYQSSRKITPAYRSAKLLSAVAAFAPVFNTFGLHTGHLPWWPFIQVFSLTAGLALGMSVFILLDWVRSNFGLLGRIHYTLVMLGALGLTWFMAFWNLLGKGF